MKEFIHRMLSGGSDVSSKRVLSFIFSFAVITMAFMHYPESLINSFFLFLSGLIGLTVAEKFKK